VFASSARSPTEACSAVLLTRRSGHRVQTARPPGGGMVFFALPALSSVLSYAAYPLVLQRVHACHAVRAAPCCAVRTAPCRTCHAVRAASCVPRRTWSNLFEGCVLFQSCALFYVHKLEEVASCHRSVFASSARSPTKAVRATPWMNFNHQTPKLQLRCMRVRRAR